MPTPTGTGEAAPSAPPTADAGGAPERRRPGRGWRIARRIGLLLFVVVAVFVIWEREFLFDRFGEVEAGKLYRSSHLSESRLEDYVEKYGIKTIVNLMDDLESDRAVARRKGLNYVANRCDQVPTQEAVDRFLAVMDDPANHPVLVHCEHGVGRTGVMSAIYRMEFDGWDVDRAIREARFYAHWDSFGPEQNKTAYLKSYVPRRLRPKGLPPPVPGPAPAGEGTK